MLNAEVRRLLSPIPGLTVLVAVGNPWRRDDGVAGYIASCLKPSDGLAVLEAGETPERILDEVAQHAPARVIMLDAADFRGTPGEARMISRKDLPGQCLSTHSIPLGWVADLIQSETGAPVFCLGIQIADAGFGEGLSTEVRHTAEEIVRLINGQGKAGKGSWEIEE